MERVEVVQPSVRQHLPQRLANHLVSARSPTQVHQRLVVVQARRLPLGSPLLRLGNQPSVRPQRPANRPLARPRLSVNRHLVSRQRPANPRLDNLPLDNQHSVNLRLLSLRLGSRVLDSPHLVLLKPRRRQAVDSVRLRKRVPLVLAPLNLSKTRNLHGLCPTTISLLMVQTHQKRNLSQRHLRSGSRASDNRRLALVNRPRRLVPDSVRSRKQAPVLSVRVSPRRKRNPRGLQHLRANHLPRQRRRRRRQTMLTQRPRLW